MKNVLSRNKSKYIVELCFVVVLLVFGGKSWFFTVFNYFGVMFSISENVPTFWRNEIKLILTSPWWRSRVSILHVLRSHDKKVQIQGLESLKKCLSFEILCDSYMTSKNSGFSRKH